MPVSRSVMAWNAPLMSRVYRELESPYFTSLLTRIASGRSFALRTASTGPKISSCSTRIAGFTPVRTVGSKTEPQLGGAIGQHLYEPVVNLVVQDEPAGRRTALTRRTERAPQHTLERQIQVGIVHHDHRVLPAHFERQPLVH